MGFLVDGNECDDSASIATNSTRKSFLYDVGEGFDPTSIAVVVEADPVEEPSADSTSPPEAQQPEAQPPSQPTAIPQAPVDPVSVLGFDPSTIIHGPVMFACREVSYQGHAATAASIEQATSIVDYISQKYKSEDCMPYAVRLVEGGELIAFSQDNGDFMCGVLVGNALKRLDGYNVLLCVTRYVKGCFVAEMVHAQKRGAVKQAAEKAADKLLATLRARRPIT